MLEKNILGITVPVVTIALASPGNAVVAIARASPGNLLPESAGSVLIRPGKAAQSARGGGLVAAAQATR